MLAPRRSASGERPAGGGPAGWLRRGCPGWVQAASFALLVAAVAAGCSVTAGSGSRTILRVVMANDWAGTPPVIDAVRAFEAAHRGVRVEIEDVYFEFMAEKVRSDIAGGVPPDVVQWHAFAAGAQGMAEPMDRFWEGRLDPAEFLSGSIEDVTWAGVRYGVPLDTNAMLLIYNAAHFREAGVSEPGPSTTFGQVEAAAARLVASNGSRRVIALPSSTWHTYGWVKANGGEVVEVGPGGKPRFTLERAENVEALGYLRGMIAGGAAYPPAGVAGDRVDAFAFFRSERTSMHASGSWDLATLSRERVPWPVRVAVMPGGTSGRTRGTVMGGSSMFVPRGSRNGRLAFDFMLHLAGDGYALRLAKEEGRLPVRVRVYDDPYFRDDPHLRVFLEQLRTAHPFLLEAFPEANRAFGDAIGDVLEGRRDAAAALAEAQRRAESSMTR